MKKKKKMAKFSATKEDIQALKKFVDDPDGEDSLKLDLLAWMWDNKDIINYPDKQKKNFHYEVLTFLELIKLKD